MQLPAELRVAIERRVDEAGFAEVARAAAELSARYREGGGTKLRTDAERAAYMAVRMPATYAAIRAVLAELPAALDAKSLLDLGAGPGTSLWAADAFESVTLVEQDRGLMDEGRAMAARAAKWEQADLRKAAHFPQHDVVLLSYTYGEIGDAALLRAAWDASQKALIVIEPGTVAGFGCVRKVRDQLIAMGAYISAPCPHANACPMTGEDWCHFAARVERTSLHRRLKGGELGHEDEKFSYVIACREPVEACEGRIVRHPRQNPGFIELTVCGRDGLSKEVVTRKNKEAFRAARRAAWGSRFNAV
jgi:ribosomal protein RSM22 (predicted rRNA methylase)